MRGERARVSAAEDREFDFIARNAVSNPEISRRRLMDWMLKSGFTLGAATFLSSSAIAACGYGGAPIGGPGNPSGGFGGGTDTLKLAVIGPFSGIGSFIGAIATRSLNAAVQQVNNTGGIGGRKVEVVVYDISAADPQQPINSYNQIVGGREIAGIIWAIPAAPLLQLKDRIAVDQVPIAAAFADMYDENLLYPQEQAYRPIFQFLLPDTWAMDTLAKYCKETRGYTRAGLLYDSTLGGSGDDNATVRKFKDAMGRYGISITGTAGYQLGETNFGPRISEMGDAQTVWMWGLATDTANAVKTFADSGREYVDWDGAKSGQRPHLMGSPAALGEKKWAELAGEAARPGTLTAWHVGGLIYLPSFEIAKWMAQYNEPGQNRPTGGEETPADAMYILANAVQRAGSTDGKAMIEAIENAGRQRFASIDFEFTADNHLARDRDDVIIVTLERAGTPADPTYTLGKEWTDVLPPGYVGPTHLVYPTLEANTRRHPDVMAEVVAGPWGAIQQNNQPGPTH